MIHNVFNLDASHSTHVKGGAVTIICAGDFHEADHRKESPAFAAMRCEFQSTPNCWLLLLGDYGDHWRSSTQRALRSAVDRDDTERRDLDNEMRKSQDPLIKRLSFAEGKIIGIHEGHHGWKFQTGETLSQRLAAALKAPFLGIFAGTRLSIEVPWNAGHSCSYTILSMHGAGSARFVTTDARQWENSVLSSWVADHYVRGHGHKAMCWVPCERRTVRRAGSPGILKSLPYMMMVGGMREAYSDGWHSSYEEQKLLLPQPVSYGVIRLRLVNRVGEQARRGLPMAKKDSRHRPSRSIIVEQLTRFPCSGSAADA